MPPISSVSQLEGGSSQPETASSTVGERVRFTGKHGKDGCLSIYVNKRNIYEYETEQGTTNCEPLGCIVRVRPTRLPADKVVVVGVLARIICDFGLQYTEHCLYQVETQIYPRLGPEWQPTPASIGGGVFDFETRFVKELPDNDHVPFLVKLPRGLPPSIYLRSSAIGTVHWGLNYFLFAYIANSRSVQATLQKQGVEGAWPRILLGRRHSRVFLSFSRTLVQRTDRICRSISPSVGQTKRRSFLGSSGIPLILEASLDKSAYYEGEPMRVNLRLRNNGRQRVGGIRLTLKQLLTVKYAHEPRQVIKSTVMEYEGHEISVRDVAEFEATLVLEPKYNTSRMSSFQIALESFLPLGPDRPRVLAATCTFHGASFNGYPFGIDKLRIFSVEYYVNVHTIIPWGSNVIVKLPFHLVSNGGVSKTWESSSKDLSSQLTRKPSIGSTISTSQTRIPPTVANLISFDGNAVDEVVEDDYNDRDDNDDVGFNGENIHPVDRLFPKSTKPAATVRAQNAEQLTWNEDLASARSILESTRTSVSALHQSILSDKLDRRSIALQNVASRGEKQRAYLEQLNSILSKDLIELKSSLQRVAQGGAEGNSQTFYAAQSTAFRLTSLANRHAEVVQMSWGREDLEEHLERMASLLDDFELFVARGTRKAWSEASLAVDRMTQKSKLLIKELAGYELMEEALELLAKTIVQCGLASAQIRHDRGRESDHDGLDSDSENDKEDGALDPTNSLESLLSELAECFQTLYNNLIDRQDATGHALLELIEVFPTILLRYTRGVRRLLAHTADFKIRPVAYFNWRFLLATVELHYLGSIGSTAGRLLIYRRREYLKWTSMVEKSIPARFILTRPTSGSDEELEALAGQIVNLMQSLS